VIVVDTNILAYLYLPGDFTEHAEALLAKNPEWAAPILWRSEFRNILAGYVRRGGLTLNQALAIQQEAESLMASNEQMVDSAAVLDLVNRSDCSAYDCEFIAVAQLLGTRLVTMDGKLLKAFPRMAKPLFGAG
jgi:predicted nucleic acid-binding protein